MLRKVYAIAFCVFTISTLALAQDKSSGIIYYDQVIDLKSMQMGAGGGGNINFSMGGPGGNMPTSITNKFEMLFSPAGAKFQKAIADEATSGMVVRLGGGRDLFFQGDKVIESFELDGEALMVENKLGFMTSNAEKSEETKIIAGFNCKKVVIAGMNNAKTIVWYTNDLYFKASPMAQQWTDGVVLGLENDRMKMYATSVDYTKVKDSEFALPKKSKLITQEEYTKKMTDYREKLKSTNGVVSGQGGQTMIIRTN